MDLRVWSATGFARDSVPWPCTWRRKQEPQCRVLVWGAKSQRLRLILLTREHIPALWIRTYPRVSASVERLVEGGASAKWGRFKNSGAPLHTRPAPAQLPMREGTHIQYWFSTVSSYPHRWSHLAGPGSHSSSDLYGEHHEHHTLAGLSGWKGGAACVPSPRKSSSDRHDHPCTSNLSPARSTSVHIAAKGKSSSFKIVEYCFLKDHTSFFMPLVSRLRVGFRLLWIMLLWT